MLNTSDYLIPLRFGSLVIQTTFSICAFITRESNSIICENKDRCLRFVWGFSITIWVTELFEFVFQFIGLTLFQNKLSLLQIIFHSITSMLYLWYIFVDWEGTNIVAMFVLGSLIPILLELGGWLYSYLFYIKVLRLN